jgi:hypothetical protein
MLNAGDEKNAQVYARKALAIAEALAATDSTNAQARGDLAFVYWTVGNSLRSIPAAAAPWYRKSISASKQLTSRSEAQHFVAFRDESLAAVLVGRNQTAERLRLLLEANGLRQELAKTDPDVPESRLHMMRSYCALSDAELAANDLSQARKYADRAAALSHEFHVSSPSLLVLRDIGYCDKVLGNVHRRAASDPALPAEERRASAAASREWYTKSSEVWREWDRRGVATPESEAERNKVEGLLLAK